MNNTSENYKSLVYADGIKHELIVYIDGKRIEDKYILDFEFKFDLLPDKVISLGETPQLGVSLMLHKNAMPSEYKTFYIESGILEGEIVPIGYFEVDGTSEDDSTITINLKDYMYKFDFDYDGSKLFEDGEKTLLQVVKDICEQAGVELGSSAFLNSDIKFSSYDNTIKAKEHLGWIAEQAGGIAYIGCDGRLYIKTLGIATYTHSHEYKNVIEFDASINSSANIYKIKGTTNGLTGNIDICIDLLEESKNLVSLFRKIHIELLEGNLNIEIPKELKEAIYFELEDNGNLNAYVYDAYKNKIDFSMTATGILIANVDENAKIIISQKIITIPLNDLILYEDDYIVFFEEENKWYLCHEEIATVSFTEIIDEELLENLNKLLNVELSKGKNKIYEKNETALLSLNYTNCVEIPINKFGEFDFSKEAFECSRVYYEDGIRQFADGDKSKNTIYINANNMYIVNESQIKNIYSKLKGLQIYGFTGSSIVDCAIEIGDIIFVEDKPILYQGSFSYLGRNKVTITSDVTSKEENEHVTKVKTNTKIKRIQSTVDEQNKKITLMGEEVSEATAKVAKMELSTEKIETYMKETVDMTDSIIGNNPLILENCKEGDLLELHIIGNNKVFKHLYPSEELYPSDTLYPCISNSIIEVNNDNIRNDVIYQQSLYRCCIDKNEPHVINNLSYCRVAFMYAEPNTRYTISKTAGKRFALGSFEISEPTELLEGLKATNYISDENEGENLTELTIITGEKDKSIIIFFWDETLDTLDRWTIFNSIEVRKNYYRFDLNVLTELKNNEEFYDEYVVKGGYGYELRRIQDDGSVIKEPASTNKMELKIPLQAGINKIEVVGYTTTLQAKWVTKNDLTDFFATQIDLSSQILLKTNEIKLSVLEEVTNEFLERKTIESSIDLGILDDQGYIAFKTNKLTIDSDNFKLSADGFLIATAGEIAGLTLETVGGVSSDFYKLMKTDDGITYQSGLWIPGNALEVPFLYAGLNLNESAGSKFDANAYITHSGRMFAKWFDINGESGYLRIRYDNDNIAMLLDKHYINRYLADGNRWTCEGVGLIDNTPYCHTVWLYDSLGYSIESGIHGQALMRIYRVGNSGESAYTNFWTDVNVWGNRMDGINNSMYIQGYEVATNASDERIKKNILDSEIKALELIKLIHHVSFDWDKEKACKEGHIDCGYIAQELMKIDKNFVIYNKKFDTYQINTLYVLCTVTKAIQELYELYQSL